MEVVVAPWELEMMARRRNEVLGCSSCYRLGVGARVTPGAAAVLILQLVLNLDLS